MGRLADYLKKRIKDKEIIDRPLQLRADVGKSDYTMSKAAAEAIDIRIGGVPLSVEVVTTMDEQAQGLMGRTELPGNSGMLFFYGVDQPLSFWMKNTTIPLSVAFIGSDGVINDIKDLEPEDLSSVQGYGSMALEVNRGWFAHNSVKVGDKMEMMSKEAQEKPAWELKEKSYEDVIRPVYGKAYPKVLESAKKARSTELSRRIRQGRAIPAIQNLSPEALSRKRTVMEYSQEFSKILPKRLRGNEGWAFTGTKKGFGKGQPEAFVRRAPDKADTADTYREELLHRTQDLPTRSGGTEIKKRLKKKLLDSPFLTEELVNYRFADPSEFEAAVANLKHTLAAQGVDVTNPAKFRRGVQTLLRSEISDKNVMKPWSALSMFYQELPEKSRQGLLDQIIMLGRQLVRKTPRGNLNKEARESDWRRALPYLLAAAGGAGTGAALDYLFRNRVGWQAPLAGGGVGLGAYGLYDLLRAKEAPPAPPAKKTRAVEAPPPTPITIPERPAATQALEPVAPAAPGRPAEPPAPAPGAPVKTAPAAVPSEASPTPHLMEPMPAPITEKPTGGAEVAVEPLQLPAPGLKMPEAPVKPKPAEKSPRRVPTEERVKATGKALYSVIASMPLIEGRTQAGLSARSALEMQYGESEVGRLIAAAREKRKEHKARTGRSVGQFQRLDPATLERKLPLYTPGTLVKSKENQALQNYLKMKLDPTIEGMLSPSYDPGKAYVTMTRPTLGKHWAPAATLHEEVGVHSTQDPATIEAREKFRELDPYRDRIRNYRFREGGIEIVPALSRIKAQLHRAGVDVTEPVEYKQAFRKRMEEGRDDFSRSIREAREAGRLSEQEESGLLDTLAELSMMFVGAGEVPERVRKTAQEKFISKEADAAQRLLALYNAGKISQEKMLELGATPEILADLDVGRFRKSPKLTPSYQVSPVTPRQRARILERLSGSVVPRAGAKWEYGLLQNRLKRNPLKKPGSPQASLAAQAWDRVVKAQTRKKPFLSWPMQSAVKGHPVTGAAQLSEPLPGKLSIARPDKTLYRGVTSDKLKGLGKGGSFYSGLPGAAAEYQQSGIAALKNKPKVESASQGMLTRILRKNLAKSTPVEFSRHLGSTSPELRNYTAALVGRTIDKSPFYETTIAPGGAPAQMHEVLTTKPAGAQQTAAYHLKHPVTGRNMVVPEFLDEVERNRLQLLQGRKAALQKIYQQKDAARYAELARSKRTKGVETALSRHGQAKTPGKLAAFTRNIAARFPRMARYGGNVLAAAGPATWALESGMHIADPTELKQQEARVKQLAQQGRSAAAIGEAMGLGPSAGNEWSQAYSKWMRAPVTGVWRLPWQGLKTYGEVASNLTGTKIPAHYIHSAPAVTSGIRSMIQKRPVSPAGAPAVPLTPSQELARQRSIAAGRTEITERQRRLSGWQNYHEKMGGRGKVTWSDIRKYQGGIKKEGAEDFAPGLPKKKRYGAIENIPKDKLLTYILQKHLAERAGPHYDLRFGDKNLYSWAIPAARLPRPKEKLLAIRQPLHRKNYAEFQGRIPKGTYGAGTVEKVDKGEVLITHVSPKKIKFVVAHHKHPETFALINTKGHDWLLVNTTPQESGALEQHQKVRYTKVDPEKMEDFLNGDYAVSAKIDGAASLFELFKDRIEAVSYRPQKGCFSVDSRVLLNDGTWCCIGDVRIGDRLHLPSGGSTVVKQLFNNGESTDWLKVDHGGQSFYTTPGHLFKVDSIGWVPIGLLLDLPDPLYSAHFEIRCTDENLRYLRKKLRAIVAQNPDVQPYMCCEVGLSDQADGNSSKSNEDLEDQRKAAEGCVKKMAQHTRKTVSAVIRQGMALRSESCAAAHTSPDCRSTWLQQKFGKEGIRQIWAKNTAALRQISPSMGGWQLRRRFKRSQVYSTKVLERAETEEAEKAEQLLRVVSEEIARREVTSASYPFGSIHQNTERHRSIAFVLPMPCEGRQTVHQIGQRVLCITRVPWLRRCRYDIGTDHPEHSYIVEGLSVHNSDAPIIHTYRMGLGEQEIPKHLRGTVLRGEIYGERGGKAIPVQELGGILNAATAKALRKQQEQDVKLKAAIFNVYNIGGKPPPADYAARAQAIQRILKHLPKDKFVVPPTETDPVKARRLYRRIKQKKHPLTAEGVVTTPLAGGRPAKVKFKEESDIYVRDIVPAVTRSGLPRAGAIKYSLTPGGPVVGEVGTGFSHELAQELLRNPQEYIGRRARIESQGQFPSGAWRAPSFIALHEG